MKTLLSSGIQPDLLICRTKHNLSENQIEKISLMTNVTEDCVFSSEDIANKYLLPISFYEKKLDKIILKKLGIYENHKEIKLQNWKRLSNFFVDLPKKQIIVLGMITKYNKGVDNYISLEEALRHASWELDINLDIRLIDSENHI